MQAGVANRSARVLVSAALVASYLIVVGSDGAHAQSVDCSSALIPNYVKEQSGCSTPPKKASTTVDCSSALIPNYVKEQNGCSTSNVALPGSPTTAAPTQPSGAPNPTPRPSAPPSAPSPLAQPTDPSSQGDCSVLDGVYGVEEHGFAYRSGAVAVPPQAVLPHDELVIQGAGADCTWSLTNQDAGGSLSLAPVSPQDWSRWLYQQPLPVSSKFMLSDWPYTPGGVAEGFIAPTDQGTQALSLSYAPDQSLFSPQQPGMVWITWRLDPNPCGADNAICPGLPGASGAAGAGACGSMELATCAMEWQAARDAGP